MKDKINKWLADNSDTIVKACDWLALFAFIFAIASGIAIGHWLYAISNACAAVWVYIAMSREKSRKFYANMCKSLIDEINDLYKKHIALKDKLSKKDTANECN